MAEHPESRLKMGAGSRNAALMFFLQVFKEYEGADQCLERLRRHFPDARVVVRSDGDGDPRYEQLSGRYDLEYLCEERLFTIDRGGAAVARMLDIFLEHPARYLFKIDPDTEIHRRFRFLPTGEGLFGSLQGNSENRSIQGGCIGLTRNAAQTISESRLLDDPRLASPDSHRGVSAHWPILADRAQRTGLSSFDWTLGWAAMHLSVPMFDFPEVCSTWRDPVDNPELQFAVTHPTRASLEKPENQHPREQSSPS